MTTRINNTNDLTVNTFHKSTNPADEVLAAFGIDTTNMAHDEMVAIVGVIRKFLTLPAMVHNGERQQDLLQMVVNVVATMTNVTPVETETSMQFQIVREAEELTHEAMMYQLESAQGLPEGSLSRLSKTVIEQMFSTMIAPPVDRHLTIHTNSNILNNWKLDETVTA